MLSLGGSVLQVKGHGRFTEVISQKNPHTLMQSR